MELLGFEVSNGVKLDLARLEAKQLNLLVYQNLSNRVVSL
jgi:hypothetical protein